MPNLVEKQPELREVIAENYVAGATDQQIADILGGKIGRTVNRSAVNQYRKDPNIRGMISRMTMERISRMTRQIDSKLEARLNGPDSIDTPTLLQIRKTIVPQKIELDHTQKDETTVADKLWAAADQSPETAERMMAALDDGA